MNVSIQSGVTFAVCFGRCFCFVWFGLIWFGLVWCFFLCGRVNCERLAPALFYVGGETKRVVGGDICVAD